MHVHAGPDIRERKLDAWQLLDAAQRAGMAGLVLKNHYYPTMLEAKLLQSRYPALAVFGGLALNYSCGGLNPEAVEKALALDAKVIWMPTHDAAHERAYYRREGGIRPEWHDRDKQATFQLLELIKAHDAVLATGHLSYPEIIGLLKVANEVGVRKKLINHPGIIFQRFSPEQQLEFLRLGAYLEHSYARPPHTIGWDELAATLRQTGTASVIIGTDLGQPQNPDPVVGMQEVWYELLSRGFTEHDLKTMTCTNPAALVGLET